MQTAHSVRGRVHLKWIRGSYNKHSHKTIITQPGSTVPSRHSGTTPRCCGRNGNVLSAPKSTHKDRPDSPPANTCLLSHNVLLQLVWRRYAVMSQPQDVLCPPPLPSLPLTLRSANKNAFVQINRRGCSSTFQCIFYEGHAVCCRCCCSDEGPHLLDAHRNSPAEENVLDKRSALDFEHTGFTHHR